ncbi:MAG: hypothetical protein RL119_1764, partial [Actinomycetota bacterium]
MGAASAPYRMHEVTINSTLLGSDEKGENVKLRRTNSLTSRSALGATLAGLMFFAVACGGSDSTSTDTGAPSSEAPTETTDAIDDPTAITPGGKLVMAVEADTSSPWRP